MLQMRRKCAYCAVLEETMKRLFRTKRGDHTQSRNTLSMLLPFWYSSAEQSVLSSQASCPHSHDIQVLTEQNMSTLSV